VRSPYVSAAEFEAYPTYLDLNDLVPGGDAAAQNAELGNALRRASDMADAYCRMPLGARIITETSSARLHTATGYCAVRLRNRPVIAVTGVVLTPYRVIGARSTQIDPTGVYELDGMWQVPAPGVYPGQRGRVEIQITYVAGYPATVTAAPAAAGARAVQVGDPTGIVSGQGLRFWDPTLEEDVSVAAGYVPGSNPVPLASPLANAHAGGAALDALPADVHDALILWTMGLLARPTSGGDEDSFADSAGPGPTTTGRDPRRTGHGLIAGAKELLDEGGYVRAM
jgi:hypothetical protein